MKRCGKLDVSAYTNHEHTVNSPARIQTVNEFGYETFHQLYIPIGKLVAMGLIDIVASGVVSPWYSMSDLYIWTLLHPVFSRHCVLCCTVLSRELMSS